MDGGVGCRDDAGSGEFGRGAGADMEVGRGVVAARSDAGAVADGKVGRGVAAARSAAGRAAAATGGVRLEDGDTRVAWWDIVMTGRNIGDTRQAVPTAGDGRLAIPTCYVDGG
ncbi:unnamed protein product [Linum trigynum]|uniref:Uncharacterized protein n=1 Tax=Linum trigynum TaxID=586398 RepID=A0AAV2G9E2_9ROSI